MTNKKFLRKIALCDLNELSLMLKDFWHTQLVEASDEDILEDIRRMLSPKCFGYLIMLDDNIAGFTFVNEKYGYTNNIEYLYIKPEFRRKGLASFALKKIKEIVLAKGNPRVQIEVAPNNLSALKFYYKQGFTSIDTITLSTSIILILDIIFPYKYTIKYSILNKVLWAYKHKKL